jgi:nucleoside-diphosphate-sugar epimerase
VALELGETEELRIAVTGAAGLVGLNLIPRLKARGHTDIVGIDKHPANTATLRKLHPDVHTIEADLACDDGWQEAVATCDAIVISHAQIGGLDAAAFERNNVTATQRLLAVAQRKSNYLIHLSSSVVKSMAVDWYTESKKAQERVVAQSGLPYVILRPTLAFGWFDRKHIGWLARFMQRVPVFPVPGDGRYVRQPLYIGDLCEIVLSCLEKRSSGVTYNITGQETLAFIDLMRLVKTASGARTTIVTIPYRLFWVLLWTYALFDRDPPFTTRQLDALVKPDLFEVIDWPGIFGVKATPLREALEQTFRDPDYSSIVLEF